LIEKMIVFDIETDGLYDTVSRFHCIVWYDVLSRESGYSTALSEALRVLEGETVIGHNIIRYDLPVLEKLSGKKITPKKVIDTLGVSWYLDNHRPKHGLESYGIEYNIPKVEIGDWENLTPDDYYRRCATDVEINTRLWDNQVRYLEELYGDVGISKILNYITFKLECARDQELNPIGLDYHRCKELLDKLKVEAEDKKCRLAESMPMVTTYKTVKRPKITHKLDGTLSKHGEMWFNLLKENGLPPTHTEPFKVADGQEKPNPSSTPQIKSWLYSLGWKPKTFKYVKDKKTGKERAVEQVRNDGELCESVIELKDKEPNLEYLEGLTVLEHRIGMLEGFLSCAIEVSGEYYLRAEIEGFTNTMRFKHRKPLVNLPGVDKPYGEEIRSLLVAPRGKKIVGADMVSLESTTKRHYIYPIDPDYADEMSQPGFDEHVNLAVHAGALTEEEERYYIENNT
jgi:hypothetical protein